MTPALAVGNLALEDHAPRGLRSQGLWRLRECVSRRTLAEVYAFVNTTNAARGIDERLTLPYSANSLSKIGNNDDRLPARVRRP